MIVWFMELDKDENPVFEDEMDLKSMDISDVVQQRFKFVNEIDDDGKNIIDEIVGSGGIVLTRKDGTGLELIHIPE